MRVVSNHLKAWYGTLLHPRFSPNTIAWSPACCKVAIMWQGERGRLEARLHHFMGKSCRGAFYRALVAAGIAGVGTAFACRHSRGGVWLHARNSRHCTTASIEAKTGTAWGPARPSQCVSLPCIALLQLSFHSSQKCIG